MKLREDEKGNIEKGCKVKKKRKIGAEREKKDC